MRERGSERGNKKKNGRGRARRKNGKGGWRSSKCVEEVKLGHH